VEIRLDFDSRANPIEGKDVSRNSHIFVSYLFCKSFCSVYDKLPVPSDPAALSIKLDPLVLEDRCCS
jgi:hypothetical protein